MTVIRRGEGRVVTTRYDLTTYASFAVERSFWIRPGRYEFAGSFVPAGATTSTPVAGRTVTIRRRCGALHKCLAFRHKVPFGRVRARGLTCRATRALAKQWIEPFFDGQPARRSFRLGDDFRCTYRQTAYRQNINPYAVVKCKAPHGRRASWESYA